MTWINRDYLLITLLLELLKVRLGLIFHVFLPFVDFQKYNINGSAEREALGAKIVLSLKQN